METNLSPERWRQIAIAHFDHYVSKRLTEPSWIVTNDGIDKRELSCLAKSVECDPMKLRSVIVASLIRTNRNNSVSLNEVQEDGEKEEITFLEIPETEEIEIIVAVIKFNIKESIVSLANLKRKLGKMPHELNRQNTDLKTTVQELGNFIRPLYKEAIDESLTF